jgi:hypothetical protein
MSLKFDDSQFQDRAKQLLKKVEENTKKGVYEVAKEVLRISNNRYVPHDTGELQNSGSMNPDSPATEIEVGYNKVYAARLHEHPEYSFQKGRVGKYLERTIVENIRAFREHMMNLLK